MYWDELTSTELAAVDRGLPVVLPLAATEQHGPHLPLATDRMIAEHLAATLVAAMPGGLLVLPVQAVGCSRHHMGHAGTLTLSHDTFLHAVLEVLESAHAHGFRRFFLLNAHGGNQAIGGVALERFGADHPDSRIVFASWWQAARDTLGALSTTGPGGVGHACEFETALMRVIAPQLVHPDAAPARANVPTYSWAEGDMLRGPQAALYRDMAAMTPTGVYGEPRAATPALGAAIVDAVIAALLPVLRDLRGA